MIRWRIKQLFWNLILFFVHTFGDMRKQQRIAYGNLDVISYRVVFGKKLVLFILTHEGEVYFPRGLQGLCRDPQMDSRLFMEELKEKRRLYASPSPLHPPKTDPYIRALQWDTSYWVPGNSIYDHYNKKKLK